MKQPAAKKIVLIRHGEALEKRVARRHKIADELRMLTPRGQKQLLKLARKKARIFKKARCLFHSPLQRSIESALMILQVHPHLELQETSIIRPLSSPNEFLKFLKKCKEERVLIVGHEPHLTRTLKRLLKKGYFQRGSLKKEMKKGTLTTLRFK